MKTLLSMVIYAILCMLPLTAQQLVWSEEFSGTTLDLSKWNYETGTGINGDWGTGQLDRATDRPENVRIVSGIPGADGNCLAITTRKETYIDRNYTSGRINTAGKASWGPGHRIVARVYPKDVRYQGQGFAFWMMPDEKPAGYDYIMWPQGGEIDIMEYVGSIPFHNLGSVHYAWFWENNEYRDWNHGYQGGYYSFADKQVPDNPEWITIDLGQNYSINKVILRWEAYGINYRIDVSTNNSTWTTVYTTTSGDGGTDEITFPTTTARYVRMYGTLRGTDWGYSLFEFEVYPAGSNTNIALNKSVTASSIQAADLAASYAVDGQTSTRWSSALRNPGYGNYPPSPSDPNAGSNGWHTYGIDWYQDRIEFFIDDNVYHIHYLNDGGAFAVDGNDQAAVKLVNGRRVKLSEYSNHFSEWHPFEHKMYVILSAGVGGSMYTYGGPIVPEAIFPCDVYIDWVRVYSLTGSGGNTTPPSGSVNLALNKPVTASSVIAGNLASYINDGNMNTRWESAQGIDPQWIQVDLQQVCNLSQVVLKWETASAKAYQIQVSNDGNSWTTLYSNTTGTGGNETINLSGTGRYIRLYGTQRNTGWGYSIWEMEVFGTPISAPVVNLALNKPVTASSVIAGNLASYINDGNMNTRWESAQGIDPQWIQVDLQQVCNLSQVVLKWETASAKAYQIQVSNDGNSWTTLYSNTTGTGGNETINLSGTGRYIRLYGTQRNTGWGYSIWEMEVYGTAQTSSNLFSQKIEAENYIAMSGIGVENTTDVGGGQNVGWIDANDWMDYQVNIPNSGTYNVVYRLASPEGGGQLQFIVNNSTLSTITINKTGGWQNWTSQSTSVTLPAGNIIIRLKAISGGFNINWFEINNSLTQNREALAIDETHNSKELKLYPNPVKNTLFVEGFSGTATVNIYDLSGQKILSQQLSNTPSAINLQKLKKGIYLLDIITDKGRQVTKIVKL